MRPLLAGAMLLLVACPAGCGGGGRPAAATTPRPSPRPRAAPSIPPPRGELETRAPLARPKAIASGRAAGRKVALTFDADMTPEMLARIRAGRAPEQINQEVID